MNAETLRHENSKPCITGNPAIVGMPLDRWLCVPASRRVCPFQSSRFCRARMCACNCRQIETLLNAFRKKWRTSLYPGVNTVTNFEKSGLSQGKFCRKFFSKLWTSSAVVRGPKTGSSDLAQQPNPVSRYRRTYPRRTLREIRA